MSQLNHKDSYDKPDGRVEVWRAEQGGSKEPEAAGRDRHVKSLQRVELQARVVGLEWR